MMCALLCAACDNDAPPIERDRMVRIHADMLVLGELHRGDSLATRTAIDSILRTHGVTRVRIEQAMDWYARHPAELDSLLKDVDRRLDTARTATSEGT